MATKEQMIKDAKQDEYEKKAGIIYDKIMPTPDTTFAPSKPKEEKKPADKPVEKPATKKLAKGGSASSRADGCATKGKTKGTMITMKGGGYAC
jgi:hypothetical protein